MIESFLRAPPLPNPGSAVGEIDNELLSGDNDDADAAGGSGGRGGDAQGGSGSGMAKSAEEATVDLQAAAT